jgi:FAD/FMN-containing dehydrogenase
MKRRTFCGSALATVASTALPPSLLRAAEATAADIPAIALDGGQVVLRTTDVNDLRSSLRGALLWPGQDDYDRARHVWNGAFDRRPALIVRCAGASDVVRAVNFGRDHGLLTAVRGGGHSLSGQSVCDGGLMIDLSAMRSIRVDPAARLARVEPGVLLGELDREAQAFGMVTPAGTVSHTGVAGLTLGGGFGRLSRKFGLACDNVASVDIVPADGRLLRANATENADLFWAVRGGGGNFGVVTSFEYRLYPFAGTVLGGPVFLQMTQAREALRLYADFQYDPPDEVYADAILTTLPDGQKAFVFDTCYAGTVADGEKALRPLRTFARPLRDAVAPAPYVQLQASGDDGFPIGRKYYIKGGFLRRIEPACIDELVDRMQTAPPTVSVALMHIGGAAARVAPQATAFSHRDARANMIVAGGWDDPALADATMEFCRSLFRAVEPFTDGFYVNDVAADDSERRVIANYGANYARLASVKAQYDPGNVFRLNANVRPKTA